MQLVTVNSGCPNQWIKVKSLPRGVKGSPLLLYETETESDEATEKPPQYHLTHH